MTHDDAYALLTLYTKNPNLVKHGLAVEVVMRWYAEKLHGDAEEWGIVGLLHDFDYEIHPTIEDHPQKGADVLRAVNVSEEIIHGVLAHAPHTGEPRDTPMKKAIFAADEISGFVIAVALVRPSKKLAEVTVESVLKKLKSTGFAAKVNREDIYLGAAELGLPLEEHVANVLAALQPHAGILGL